MKYREQTFAEMEAAYRAQEIRDEIDRSRRNVRSEMHREFRSVWLWMLVLALIFLLHLATAHAATVEVWRCQGNKYQDRPCADGRRLSVDTETNIVAPTHYRSLPDERPSGPSVLMIRKQPPRIFEGQSKPHPPLIFGPPTVNVRIVR